MADAHTTPPGTWGWRTDRFRDAVWSAYVWCRLAGAGIVGMAAIAGAGDHESLRDAVLWLAVAFMAWVVATTVARRPIRRALEARPALGLAEVGVGMTVVAVSGPNGAFSGWTAAPIAMAAILRPGWKWLASVAAIQVVLVWAAGLALMAWTADPTYEAHITLTRAALTPVDYLITYGLVALLGAALRRGDRLRADLEVDLPAAERDADEKALSAIAAATAVDRLRAQVFGVVGRPCEEINRRLGVLAGDVGHLPALQAGLNRLQHRFARLNDLAPSGVRNLGELLWMVFEDRGIDRIAVCCDAHGDDAFNPLSTRVSEEAATHLRIFSEEAVGNMRRHGDPPYAVEVSGRWAEDDSAHDTITLVFVSHQRPHAPEQQGRWILPRGRRDGHRSHGVPILKGAAAALGGETHKRHTMRLSGPAHERVLEFPAHRVRAATKAATK